MLHKNPAINDKNELLMQNKRLFLLFSKKNY